MKVLFDYDIFQNFKYGGISRYVMELHSQFRKLSVVDSYICAPFCGNEYVDAQRTDPRVLFQLPALQRLPKGKRLLRELIMQGCSFALRPDIVHCTYFYRSKPSLLGKALVVTLHDMTNELLPKQFPANDHLPNFKRTAIQAADHVICISEQTRNDAKRFYNIPDEKLSVVHHGAPCLPKPSALPREIAGKPYILFVGQREGYKNFASLLEGFASSPRLYSEFNLVACGGGSFNSTERQRISDLGLSERSVLHVAGPDGILAALYKHATLLVYPSLYEGFGMPVLEAFSQRCPVVAMPCGAITEIAEDAVEYVSDRSSEGILRAVENVIYDPDRTASLKDLGSQRLSEFSWEKCALKTYSAYQKASESFSSRCAI